MSRFTISNTPLDGLKIIERYQLPDARGFFCRVFCADELSTIGWQKPLAQINYTVTKCQGTIRGMHYQYPPYMEMKLVTCLMGEVWDVAVDIRANSPTFLQWYGICLSAENNLALLLPEGFAHGFQTLSDNVELLYCHSEAYCRGAEGGLNPQDPELGIDWPVVVTELSPKDLSHPLIDSEFKGVVL